MHMIASFQVLSVDFISGLHLLQQEIPCSVSEVLLIPGELYFFDKTHLEPRHGAEGTTLNLATKR